MLLRRDATGRILDGSNPIILVGGQYYLFRQSGIGDYGIDFGGQSTPTIKYVDKEPCPVPTMTGTLKPWSSNYGQGGFFQTMKAQRNNLVRVFLTNSYVTSDSFPYNVVGGKLAVQDAVENGHWNDLYFSRLLEFAQQANTAGIAIQLSVFNFFDFDKNAWPHSPWNPLNTVDLSPNWSTIHLVADAANREGRCANFMNVTNNNLTAVKGAFINKLVTTLRPQGNVILELMNEPRGLPAKDQAKFLSHVTGLLLGAFGSWRPLLSVNAFPPSPSSPTLDIEQWKADMLTVPFFDDIDIVSYHGLSGKAIPEGTCPPTPGNPNAALFPCVDRASIMDRRSTHFGAFQKKAMIFSTDGAQQYKQTFTGGEMAVRDGQIRTNLNSEAAATPVTQRHFSDLGNWAYWCLREAITYPGRCHFQNLSSFYRSILLIQEAYASAQSGSTGNQFAPPYVPSAWTTWQFRSIPPGDFNTAVHFDGNTGEIVVQLGTVVNQVDVAQAGATEVGFLHVFTATSNSAHVVASYSPTSVTVHSSGATVIPAVALRIHAVDANGNVGALIARQPVLLQHGSPPGSIELSAVVSAGQRYALILAADVGVQYQNRWQGYGEVIVRYLGATLSF